MPRYGRMIPAFGTMQSFKSNFQELGVRALELAQFKEKAAGIVQRITDEHRDSLVSRKSCKNFYKELCQANIPCALVWKPMCGVGHAAVFIKESGDGYKDTDNYASLFPDERAGPEALLPGKKSAGSASSFATDCLAEGSFEEGLLDLPEDGYRLPEYKIEMPNLNANDMRAEWLAIRDKNGMHYRLMRKNCSTIAARVIRAGAPGSIPMLAAHQVWWTPYDVITLARAAA